MDFLEMKMDIDKLKKFTAGLFDKIEGNRKRLNDALEKGTAVAFHGIYHETINTRIKNICNVLGMDLNDTISKFLGTEPVKEARQRIWDKITALEKEQKAFIEVCQEPCSDCKLNKLEDHLRELIPISINAFNQLKTVFSGKYDSDLLKASTVYKSYKELLVKLDSVGEKEGDCEIADIKGRLQQLPADSKPAEPISSCTDCKFRFPVLNNIHCSVCKGYDKFEPKGKCEECGGYRMGGYMIHDDGCSKSPTTTQPDFTNMLLPDHKIHELKTIPRYFKPLLERTKNFEIRINDRDFKVGDFLRLKEYNYEIKNDQIIGYTGKELVVVVTYILRAEGSFFSFLDDYIIMAIRHLKK